MSATNSFTLVGVVNCDPEVVPYKTGNGNVVKVVLNCQSQKFTGGGMTVDYADYDVTGFGKVGERLAQLVRGTTVAINGDLSSRTWRSAASGKDGRSMELLAKEVSILSEAAADAF